MTQGFVRRGAQPVHMARMSRLLTRRGFAICSAAFAAAALTRPAYAQAVVKAARILVGFPPGGSSDLAARLLADRMKGYAPTVIVENKAGAGGRLALESAKTGA